MVDGSLKKRSGENRCFGSPRVLCLCLFFLATTRQARAEPIPLRHHQALNVALFLMCRKLYHFFPSAVNTPAKKSAELPNNNLQCCKRLARKYDIICRVAQCKSKVRRLHLSRECKRRQGCHYQIIKQPIDKKWQRSESRKEKGVHRDYGRQRRHGIANE